MKTIDHEWSFEEFVRALEWLFIDKPSTSEIHEELEVAEDFKRQIDELTARPDSARVFDYFLFRCWSRLLVGEYLMAIHYFFESSGGDIYGVYGDQEIDLHLERERDFGTPLTITDEFRQLAETLIHSYRGYSYVAEFFEVARVSTRLFESMNVRERFKRSEVIFTSLPLDIEAIVDLSDETLSKILVEFPTSYLKDLIAADEGRKVADRLAKFLTDSERVKTFL